MILELVATCVIASGPYTVPEGWTLTRIDYPGCVYSSSIVTIPGNRTIQEWWKSTVTLRRTVQVGEKVKAPDGCEDTMEQKSDQKELEQVEFCGITAPDAAIPCPKETR